MGRLARTPPGRSSPTSTAIVFIVVLSGLHASASAIMRSARATGRVAGFPPASRCACELERSGSGRHGSCRALRCAPARAHTAQRREFDVHYFLEDRLGRHTRRCRLQGRSGDRVPRHSPGRPDAHPHRAEPGDLDRRRSRRRGRSARGPHAARGPRPGEERRGSPRAATGSSSTATATGTRRCSTFTSISSVDGRSAGW